MAATQVASDASGVDVEQVVLEPFTPGATAAMEVNVAEALPSFSTVAVCCADELPRALVPVRL
jgi:hypothetical protein